MDKNYQIVDVWLDGYDLERLVELYNIYEPIREATEEQYKPYFEYSNEKYYNFQLLEKYSNNIKELLVSNFGNIKYNGLIIPSTIVSNGPNIGIDGGRIDHYREIIFLDLPIKRYVFKTYRLIAEVWCNNPNPKKYTTVHHIGDDSFDNKNNLLFVTNKQHLSIHNKAKKISRINEWVENNKKECKTNPVDLRTPEGKDLICKWTKTAPKVKKV